MNREAIRWIEVLDGDHRDEAGNPIFDWRVRKEMFQMAQDWLLRSRKLWPEDKSTGEGQGITDMREWMNSPQNLASIETMFKARGWLPPPVKRTGRPTKAEAEERRKFEAQKKALKDAQRADDDSALKALMKGKIPTQKDDDQ